MKDVHFSFEHLSVQRSSHDELLGYNVNENIKEYEDFGRKGILHINE